MYIHINTVYPSGVFHYSLVWIPWEICHQLGSLVVELSLHVWEVWVWFPTESNQRYKIGSWQNNVSGRDISVRQHYKVVVISSVTSMHNTDMTWNVLKGTLKPIQKQIGRFVKIVAWFNFIWYTSQVHVSISWLLKFKDTRCCDFLKFGIQVNWHETVIYKYEKNSIQFR